MEILLTKNPIIGKLRAKSVQEKIADYIETATRLNIATGFVSNESIAELKRLVDYRRGELNLSLFIGMNYIEGFTRLQYEAVKELHSFLGYENLGAVYVSPNALFHGKMYSFSDASHCLGAFVGSSNLGSFIGTSQNYIESDLFFDSSEAKAIDDKIGEITNLLGQPISSAKEIENFIEPPVNLLDSFEHVEKLTDKQLKECLQLVTGEIVSIPLKTEPKSNLNSYFGAGKIKNKFSRRDYYEVEIIISKNTPNIDILPTKDDGTFWVVTTDGYKFECSRQGDYSKNFRSQSDLKILGKWIKGQMENCGALKIGEMVTEDTLHKFGKHSLVLKQTRQNDFWILDLA